MRTTLLAVVLLMAIPASTAAQLTHQQSRALRDKASVFVVASDGTWTGRLIAIDPISVTIQLHDGSPKMWPLGEVVRVETQKWDSPYDGAAAGAIAMAVYSFFAGLTIAAEAPNKGSVFLTLTATGAFAGYAIDAAHRSKVRVVLYEPSLTSARAPGLFVTVRF